MGRKRFGTKERVETGDEEMLSGKLTKKRKPWQEIDENIRTAKKETDVVEKYSRGEGVDSKMTNIKNPVLKHRILTKEQEIKDSESLAAKTELLLSETPGFIEQDDYEVTRKLSQSDIRKAVDITSASKQFELNLSFGPYRLDYTRNGRHLLIGGRRGHVAAFDWVTKSLMCEMNVMESVHDVAWLHVETMFAVAQKDRVYVYNNQGVEMHCIQDMHHPVRLEFLPYHFLLAASSDEGWLKWLDITMGKMVAGYYAGKGRLGVLTQNPFNAILCSGHSNGTVSMWSPNMKKPVATMLCHGSSVQALAVDHQGYYMASGGCLRDLKLWDIRQLNGPLQSYRLTGGSASDLAFSQTGLLSAAAANTVQIFKNCVKERTKEPYLVHRTGRAIQHTQFCPYEDVLGLATDSGLTSILVPGAGEANFDALEVNPMRSKKQRQETEVRTLLDKIPAEMISLDPTVLAEVDLPTLKEKWDAQRKILNARAPDINFTPRKKKKQGNSLRRDRVKSIIRQDAKKAFFNKIADTKQQLLDGETEKEADSEMPKNVLDRFKSKRKRGRH